MSNYLIGEFVDFETLEDWESRDAAKDARIEELEAKLAQAVKALRDIEGRSRPINPTGNPKWINDHARATLAELKKQDNGE